MLLREVVKQWLIRRGLSVSASPGCFEVSSYKLRKLKARGFAAEVVVDGGAASGDWTRQIKQYFPEARVLCVEPRDDAQAGLAELQSQFSGIHIAHTLVGQSSGTVTFSVHGAQSSMLPNASGETFGQTVEAPVTTLDSLIEDHGLGWPDLIKLDLQGAELDCLKGAPRCLSHAQMVVLEVSFIPLMAGTPLVAEVMSFMSDHGYRCYDIWSLWGRPLDGALAQGDFVFIREGHPLITDARWSEKASWS